MYGTHVAHYALLVMQKRFGALIRELRDRVGLSQGEYATAAGVSLSTVQNAERSSDPWGLTWRMRDKLAKPLNLTETKLMQRWRGDTERVELSVSGEIFTVLRDAATREDMRLEDWMERELTRAARATGGPLTQIMPDSDTDKVGADSVPPARNAARSVASVTRQRRQRRVQTDPDTGKPVKQ